MSPSLAAKQNNVLFILVDDLRPELGCYGAKHIHSPNIDAFAKTGMVFERAYCQQAVCNPSRTSLMTGMRPDSTGVTGNHSHFRSNHPDVVTLPQHFKRHGYHTAAVGKIYHGVFPDGASKTKWDTMGDTESWSEPAIRFGPRYYYTEEGIAAAKDVYKRVYKPQNPGQDDWTQKLVFGPATEAPDVPDNTLYDGKVADAAARKIQQLAEGGKPFFLAVGFIKPHSPYIAPKKYFGHYNEVMLPSHPEFPSGTPSLAGHGSGELRRYTDQPKNGPIPLANQRDVRKAYYACISYIDTQVGRVLGQLRQSGLEENTIVVLAGDHGYHLGEHGLWGKTTNFELDTRVPVVVRAPGMKSAGKKSRALVELVDLYPTLADLTGLPVTKQLEGKSFALVLNDQGATTKTEALSQYPRGGGLMGYSMRTPNHRLTQWVHRITGEVRETELYGYKDSLVEKENIAGKNPELVAQLSDQLQTSFGLEPPTPSTSFEKAKAGGFDKLETQVGTWLPGEGRTIVDDKHAKTGKHCLQLTGGKKTSVILEIGDGTDTSGMLTFWAERWTSRKPFSFRIEKRTGDNWREIFNGDASVRVGRSFLNHVKVPLGDKGIRELRFSVTSPPNTGVLFDDIRIAPAKPQKVKGVGIVPMTLPALVGLDSSPLAKLRIETQGALEPISLVGIKGKIEGAGLSTVRVAGKVAKPDKDGTFKIELPDVPLKLNEGENFIVVEGTLGEDADIDAQVGVAISKVTLSNGQSFQIDEPASLQRMGVAVRKGGDDGVHTYRIPGLVTSNKGTLIGVYDIRRGNGGDLPGNIDVGMSRSTDGGRTWEPMKVIMDMGEDPKWHYDGIGDPAVLVDRNTGTIWVAATWSHGNRSWRGSEPGLEPEETGQLMLVRSDDDGVTWSAPINITKQVKKPEWCFLLQGPGKGITMQDGTIVFAAQYQDPPEKKRMPHSTILYSKDHGQTWHVGTGAFDDTTEAQVVEVEPGVLMLNCRYNRKGVRVVMTTRDMGKTWQKHPTSERALIEPGSCMASLVDTGDWLLFSNPDSTRGRHHITIKASPDRGQTWPKANRLLLDEGKGRGYSCMTMVDDNTVGILYEGSQADMTFQRIPLCDLIGKGKKTDPTVEEARLRMPQVFGDHMVLQSGIEIPVWGKANPGKKVKVKLANETRLTTADGQGEWSVRMPPRPASKEPVGMVVESGDEHIQFQDILVGEVWVCAGQSNMEWELRQSTHGKEELAAADHPDIRLLNLVGGARGSSGSYTGQHLTRLNPANYSKGKWAVASTASAANFSAVAWYFGRKLHTELDVPIGLICPAVGGTPTEAWIPRSALEADPDLKVLVADNWLDNPRLGEFCRTRAEQNLMRAMQAGEKIPSDKLGPNHSFKPGFMWSAGIEPLVPYSIRGAIWYQGESNAETPGRACEHGKLLPLLASQWREHWGQGDFPFYYVQLPSMDRPAWPEFRDGQRRALDRIPNTGMAVTIDTGLPNNVHPPHKKPVGERLAGLALGKEGSPLFVSAESQGEALVVTFKDIGEGLKVREGQNLLNFEVRNDKGGFWPAAAKVISPNKVAVSSPNVPEPTHVRYAWKAVLKSPVGLLNSEELPASPFTSEGEDEVYSRQEAPDGRPNILFIVSEDNSDHLGCYGEKRVHTPHLDALATGGVRYTRAYVPYSVCSPSRAAFLTGLYTRQTGHIGLATHRFSMYRDFKTMPAYFREAGYYTGFLGKTHVNPARLVEDHIDHRAISSSNFGKTTSIGRYAEEAHKVMRDAAARKKPFLLIINYADAHRKFVGKSKNGFPTVMVNGDIEPYPWIGSDSPHLREELRDYLNCMNRLDEGVGMILDKMEEEGVRDNTMVIYISDHGADFPRAKGSIYENGTRIPMIVNHPGNFPDGKVENAMVSTLDILPTMMRGAGIPVPEHLPGFALQDLDSGAIPPRKYIHTFTTGSSPNLLYLQFGIRDDRHKLVYNPDRALNRLGLSRYKNSNLPEDQHLQSFLYPPEFELYDLKEDPHEWTNLADHAGHAEVKRKLLEAMQAFQREIKDPLADPGNVRAFIKEQKEYLNKPYKRQGFRWPHLDMFEKAQTGRQILFQRREIPKGVKLEGHNAKGAKTYGYRIPSLLVTKKGSVLAFSERRVGLHDHAQNDIVLRRSTDGGRTWGPEIVAHEDGMNSINDPLTVQLENGRILLMFARFPYGRHARDAGWIKMADKGYDNPEANVLTFICHSDDDGRSWSEPVDISRQVKAPQLLNANTPGAMVQLTKGAHKGRIVTGLWGALPIVKDGKKSREFRIVVAYSDDNGKSWKRTEPLEDVSGQGFPNECQVAEASNGDIVLISRNQGGTNFRKKAFSRDGGETWSPVNIDRSLPSVACMGSLVKGPVKEDGSWDLWASFPSAAGRKNGQIAVSKDQGKTWRITKVIPGPFAYSAMQVSPDQQGLLLLYESNGYQTQSLLYLPFDELEPKLAAKRPNIILILADDLGYSDLGCYGGEIQTPNLDALAKDGLRFARFYNAGRCCPTRASLLTGVYPHQAGVGHMTYDAGEPGYRGDLNPETATMAETLKAAGYRTGMFGKWHLTPNTKPDMNRSNWPRQRGFDRFYGTLPGYGSLWNPAGLYDGNQPVSAQEDFFYTDTITDRAIDFVRAGSDKPYFLYLAYTAPHYPLHAREKTIRKYDGVYDCGWDVLRERRFKRLKQLGLLGSPATLPPRDEGSIPWKEDKHPKWQAQRMQTYAAMVDEMDQAIGRLLAEVSEDTMVVFLSDNGGSPEGHLHNTIERMEKPWTSSLIPKATRNGEPVVPGDIPGVDLGPENTFGSYGLRWASLSNTPFRRHKAWMHEGGICTPCIIRWPEAKGKGSITRQAGHIIDLMPTFLELAGARPPNQKIPLQGKSLLGVLKGGKLQRDYLAWEHEGNRAIRQGKWKLVSEFPGTWTYFYPYKNKGAWELYDLEADSTELVNLASQSPGKVAEMTQLYREWADTSLVVDWKSLSGRKE